MGNTVCYILKGQQVVRMSVTSTKPPTVKQLANRAEMGLINKFLRPIKILVRIGFGPEAKKGMADAYNIALGYTKKHALTGEWPDRQINYTKVMLSLGDLPPLGNVELALAGQSLTVSWSPACNAPGRGSDRVLVLAYYPAQDQGVAVACFNHCGVLRSRGQDVLVLPAQLSGRPVEVYVFVQAADGRAVSNSQYLGRLV